MIRFNELDILFKDYNLDEMFQVLQFISGKGVKDGVLSDEVLQTIAS